MKIVVITGEESGDKLAASAIKELKKISNEPLKIYGIGGRALEKEGIQKFFDISDINVMGLIEVIPKIFKINRIIKSVVNQITHSSFNKKLQYKIGYRIEFICCHIRCIKI